MLTNQEIGDKFFEKHLPANATIEYIDYKYMTGSKKAKDSQEILMIFHHVEKPKDLGEAKIKWGVVGVELINDLDHLPNTIVVLNDYRDRLKHQQHKHQVFQQRAFQLIDIKGRIIISLSGGLVGVKAGALGIDYKLHLLTDKWQCAP